MTFDELLGNLERKLGAGTLPRDADGGCVLRFADGVHARLFMQGRSRLYLEGELEPLPRQPAEAEQLLRQVLGRAIARFRDRPETIALDEASDRLVIYRRLELDGLTHLEFEQELAEFLDQIETWRAPPPTSRGMIPSPMMIFP